MIAEDGVNQRTMRILLVEDHASFRQALALVFDREDEFEVVAQAGSIAEAREAIAANPVDAAVVDLALPDGSGANFIREIADGKMNVSTLVLSASLDPSQFAEAVEAGASGVLHKSAGLYDIVDAVRRMRAGEVLLSPTQVIEMLRVVNRKRQEEQEARRSIEKLTRREREVLQALSEGLDSKQIAAKLHITFETERTHMVNILNKLGLHSRLQALVFALRYGIVEIG